MGTILQSFSTISGKIARKLVEHRQRIMFIGSLREVVLCRLTLEGIAPFRTVEIVGNSCTRLHEWPYIKFLTIGGQEFSGRDG